MRLALFTLIGCTVFVLSLNSCDDDKSSSSGNNANNVNNTADGVSGECGSVRMTQYTSSDRRWCGFDRSSSILPEFVREGMTVAIAEPYAGSSYGGDPGEACGECWEISTTFATKVVMVHDICPIEGNPICAGSHFHFDVSSEVAEAIDGGGWLGEAAVRRVPCPVSGDIHLYVTARNQWGYLQLAFFNHRIPIRLVEYRAADSQAWLPLERCLARWCLDGDTTTFAENGPGGYFRFTSASGEVVEGGNLFTYATQEGSDFDTGAQFVDVEEPEGVCRFTVPGAVYADEYGGIDGVRWMSNTWGDTTLEEVTVGCAQESASCLELENFEGSGLHLTYRHIFPRDDFASLTLRLRSSVAGTVQVAPRNEESRCANSTIIEVGETWSDATINLLEACPESDWLHGLTISHPSSQMDLTLDDIIFQ